VTGNFHDSNRSWGVFRFYLVLGYDDGPTGQPPVKHHGSTYTGLPSLKPNMERVFRRVLESADSRWGAHNALIQSSADDEELHDLVRY